MDIALILTTINESVKLIKTMSDADRSMSEADLKLTIANVTGMLADAKIGVIEKGDEIRTLQQEIERLQSFLAFRGELAEREGFKYDVVDGALVGMRYCPACEVSHMKFYRIVLGNNVNQRTCPDCRYDYGRAAAKLSRPNG